MWHVGVWRRPGNCSVVCMRVNRGAARGDRVRSYCWERSGAWTCGSWSRTGFVTVPSVPSPECRNAFFSCWTFRAAYILLLFDNFLVQWGVVESDHLQFPANLPTVYGDEPFFH